MFILSTSRIAIAAISDTGRLKSSCFEAPVATLQRLYPVCPLRTKLAHYTEWTRFDEFENLLELLFVRTCFV